MLGGEVVSCDSMQIYRGMDIGTAKPTPEEMQGVPHHMIDIADPTENYSVSRYAAEATACVDDILARGKLPIVVGGTGLYIDSLIAGRTFADGTADTALRQELSERYDEIGGEGLLGELRKFDPERAAKLHPADKKRIVRAMEVYILTGKTITQHDAETRAVPPRYDAAKIALTFADRQDLYACIDRRVDAMMQQGLLDEVRALLAAGIPADCTAMQAIGYKELVRALDAGGDLAPAVEEIKRRSRQYAKRQLTWFRRKEDTEWILLDKMQDFFQCRADFDRLSSGKKDYHRRTKDKKECVTMQQTQTAVQQRKRNLQDYLLSKLRRSRMGATVFLVNGFQIRGRSGALTPLWWSFTATESSRWCTSMPSPLWSPSGRCPGRRKTRIDRALPRVPAPPDEAGGRGEIEKG